jgi:hypothetical protein
MTFWHLILFLGLFATTCFFQNAAFTWSSRSRNSNDPNYHRKAAWASNGVYYLTNALLTIYIVKTQVWWMLGIQGLVYTLAAAEGSVYMMKKLLGKEQGKRKVGNQFTDEEAASLKQLLIGPPVLVVNSTPVPAQSGWVNYNPAPAVAIPGQGAKV